MPVSDILVEQYQNDAQYINQNSSTFNNFNNLYRVFARLIWPQCLGLCDKFMEK